MTSSLKPKTIEVGKMMKNSTNEKSDERFNILGEIGWRGILRFIAFVLLFPMVLMIAAGNLNWVMGWIYVLISITFAFASRIIMIYRNPELILERAKSLEAEDAKGWDKAFLLFGGMLGPLVAFIVIGLDERFNWSPEIPLSLQLVALVMVILGYLFSTWAMSVNKFFSAVVRIQKDRNQTVVTDGPYRYVRHPGYTGGIVALITIPIMLGSLWGLVPVGIIVFMTIIRTELEDKTLREELDGYENYAQKVHYKLFPRIW
ncbi:MAG: methyltransferase family protein [Candidatus Methanofastidiosia archaeon]